MLANDRYITLEIMGEKFILMQQKRKKTQFTLYIYGGVETAPFHDVIFLSVFTLLFCLTKKIQNSNFLKCVTKYTSSQLTVNAVIFKLINNK